MKDISIYVDGRLLELPTGFTGIRMNSHVFDPTKLRGNQAEYSFTFSIPSTRENDITFGHANVSAQPNKFRRRYNAQVYADGVMIFDGSLALKSYKDGMYSCNLVSMKVWSNEDIFGDAVLSDIPWEVDYNGAPTINQVNADANAKYAFPLVSYGVFIKEPYDKDDVGGYYTPKSTIDKWNKFWHNSFYPSLNVLETIKKAYEWKGYSVNGTAFSDPVLSNIYASCKLSPEQVPVYNLGNEKLGRIRVSGQTSTTSSTYITQDLNFPYFKVNNIGRALIDPNEDYTKYNFQTVNVWSLLNNDSRVVGQSYMFENKSGNDNDESVIVVPADGFYRINLYVSGKCDTMDSFTAKQWRYYNDAGLVEENMTITPNVKESTPIEIQLVRNYNAGDKNVELIKGSQNVRYLCGDPNIQTFGDQDNRIEWWTAFPHQDIYGADSPTKTDGIIANNTDSNASKLRGDSEQNPHPRRWTHYPSSTVRNSLTKEGTIGYISQPRGLMPYDPAVSPIFICGMSTMNEGCCSVIKNGYSWSKGNSDKNESFSEQPGMALATYELVPDNTPYPRIITSTTETEFCRDSYPESPSCYISSNKFNGRFTGRTTCAVWLNKNDVLELLALQRDYQGSKYSCSVSFDLDIQAISPRHKDQIKSSLTWNTPTEFPQKLQLGNFMSDSTKVSDWIEDVARAFNLTVTQDGKTIQLDKTATVSTADNPAVELDGKCDVRDGELSVIDYPSEMSVKWTINKDEWGFEQTVPQEFINDINWYEHGDSGYTVIKLNDDSYATSSISEQLPFSYTYWMDFTWEDYDTGGTLTGTSHILTPVIELSRFMAEGYGYEGAMEHDGYSLSQRFWYRPTGTTKSVVLADANKETVNIYLPERVYGETNISYKDSEKSLLTEYFNLAPQLGSNYLNIEVDLTAEEYTMLKGGAFGHIDSDLYNVCDITGYDPTHRNPTKLKMMKM